MTGYVYVTVESISGMRRSGVLWDSVRLGGPVPEEHRRTLQRAWGCEFWRVVGVRWS